jgi:hypothetical protein
MFGQQIQQVVGKRAINSLLDGTRYGTIRLESCSGLNFLALFSHLRMLKE